MKPWPSGPKSEAYPYGRSAGQAKGWPGVLMPCMPRSLGGLVVMWARRMTLVCASQATAVM